MTIYTIFDICDDFHCTTSDIVCEHQSHGIDRAIWVSNGLENGHMRFRRGPNHENNNAPSFKGGLSGMQQQSHIKIQGENYDFMRLKIFTLV